MHAGCEIEQCLMEGPAGSERLQRVGGELWLEANARRFKAKLVSLQHLGKLIARQSRCYFLPRGRMCWRGRGAIFHDHFTARFDDQLVVRFFDSEIAEMVSEVVDALGDGG